MSVSRNIPASISGKMWSMKSLAVAHILTKVSLNKPASKFQFPNCQIQIGKVRIWTWVSEWVTPFCITRIVYLNVHLNVQWYWIKPLNTSSQCSDNPTLSLVVRIKQLNAHSQPVECSIPVPSVYQKIRVRVRVRVLTNFVLELSELVVLSNTNSTRIAENKKQGETRIYNLSGTHNSDSTYNLFM